MNYFIEGLQGSGKSTLVRKLSEKYRNCTAVMEGDYSPIELAWCARMSEAQYSEVLAQWNDLRDQIISRSHREDDCRIVCYTQVKSENPDFYHQLERVRKEREKLSISVEKVNEALDDHKEAVTQFKESLEKKND